MFVEFFEFVVIAHTAKMPNYGAIIEITGNETMIKNTFGFGIQVFGNSSESVQLPGRFQCTHTDVFIELSRLSMVIPKTLTSVWD